MKDKWPMRGERTAKNRKTKEKRDKDKRKDKRMQKALDAILIY